MHLQLLSRPTSQGCLVTSAVQGLRCRDKGSFFHIQQPSLPKHRVSPNTKAAVRASPLANIASVADASPLPAVIGAAAVAGLGVLVAGVVLNLQLNLVTAGVLTNHVPKGAGPGGARVLQLGGGVKELYYYPRDTVLVTVVGEKLRPGLWGQAGVQAGVPTALQQRPVWNLSFQPNGSVDAVVALGVLGGLGAAQRGALLREAARVLCPGGALIVVQRVVGEGAQAVAQVALGNWASRAEAATLAGLERVEGFDAMAADVALAAWDPHLVGVARRCAHASAGQAADARQAAKSVVRQASKGGAAPRARGFQGGR